MDESGAASQTRGSQAGAKGRGGAKRSKSKPNVLHQRLGSLTFHQATQMLGEDGARLMRQGSRFTEIDPDDVFLGRDLLRVKMCDTEQKYGSPEEPPPQSDGSDRRERTAEETPCNRLHVSGGSGMPGDPDDQCRQHQLESAVCQRRHQL